MNYTIPVLAALGLFGILIHNLNNLNKINRQCDGFIDWKKYFSLERFSIMLSVCVVAVAIFCSQEIKQIQQAGKWMGLGMAAIGYMAQSLIVSFNNRAEKFVQKQSDKND